MNFVECLFIIAVDSREQKHYKFNGLKAGAAQGYKPLVVNWQWAPLKTGDYSIQGLENDVCIERKTMVDLFNSVGQGRERFEREHERMAAMQRAAVVIEAEWSRILTCPPEHTQLKPKVVIRTAMSWWVRYGVPWFTLPTRRTAEQFTFRLLEKFWQERTKNENSNKTS